MKNIQDKIDYFHSKEDEILKENNFKQGCCEKFAQKYKQNQMMFDGIYLLFSILVCAILITISDTDIGLVIIFTGSFFWLAKEFFFISLETIKQRKNLFRISIISKYYLNSEEMRMVQTILDSYRNIKNEEKKRIFEKCISDEGVSLYALFLILQKMDFLNREISKKQKIAAMWIQTQKGE